MNSDSALDIPSLTRSRVGGAFALFALFLPFCATILAISASWQSYRRSVVLSTWPSVIATVQHCGVERDYPFRKDGGGIMFWIRCDLQYEAAGQEHTTRLESTMRHTGLSGTMWVRHGASIVAERPEPSMRAWVRRHPPGSSVPLRYDPSHAAEATWIGAEPLLDVDPVPGSVEGALLFAGLGALAWLGKRRFLPQDMPVSAGAVPRSAS